MQHLCLKRIYSHQKNLKTRSSPDRFTQLHKRHMMWYQRLRLCLILLSNSWPLTFIHLFFLLPPLLPNVTSCHVVTCSRQSIYCSSSISLYHLLHDCMIKIVSLISPPCCSHPLTGHNEVLCARFVNFPPSRKLHHVFWSAKFRSSFIRERLDSQHQLPVCWQFRARGSVSQLTGP